MSAIEKDHALARVTLTGLSDTVRKIELDMTEIKQPLKIVKWAAMAVAAALVGILVTRVVEVMRGTPAPAPVYLNPAERLGSDRVPKESRP